MGPRLTLLDTTRTSREDLVDTPIGVSAVLRSIASTRARAFVYFDDGDTFLPTSVLGVEQPAFFFAKGDDAKLNGNVLSTPELTLVTTDRSVPVQFTFSGVELAPFDGVEAFRAAMPAELLRVQRRDFYRLPGHVIDSLIRFQLVPAHEPQKNVRPKIIDLSCGGMAMDIPVAATILPDGSRHTCTIEFPGLGRIDTPLYVCSSREVKMDKGIPGRRYGIEFLNLETKGVALIQRFINDEQRRLIRGGQG